MSPGPYQAPVDTLDPVVGKAVFSAPAPDAVFLRNDNNLRVTVFNAAAGVELVLRTRILLPNGELQVGSERCVPTTDRAATAFTFQLGEGWLLGLAVFATAGTPRVGQCFAVVDVIRGDSSAAIVVASLVQGYVTDTQRLLWPGMASTRSTEGPGVVRTFTGADPGAGANALDAVPTNARWRVRAMRIALVTDATVANREMVLRLTDAGTPLADVVAGFSQTASTTVTYTFALGVQAVTPTVSLVRALPFPDLALQGGMDIRTAVTNLQAGDNLAAPQYLIEEWIED